MGIYWRQAQKLAPHPACPLAHPGKLVPPPRSRHLSGLRGQGLWLSPRAQAPAAISLQYTAICPAQPAGLPFHIDITRHLSSEWVHIIQNHILRVPDDDSELIARGCIREGFQTLDRSAGRGYRRQEGPGPGSLTFTEHLMCAELSNQDVCGPLKGTPPTAMTPGMVC